jgi:RNA polymerase sigma factor (sigma-70 family)
VATSQSGAAAKPLRILFHQGTIRDLTDGQLLERFATGGGEPAELAFAALVERHGPMVMRVCRGVLTSADDAHDAFQATFLVLVKKARGLWVRDSLGPWLHQVAYRTASSARSSAARRRRHEQEAAAPRHEARVEVRDDLASVLHEEIERLPERFRAPLILCDLEGHSHEQAARTGCATGSAAAVSRPIPRRSPRHFGPTEHRPWLRPVSSIPRSTRRFSSPPAARLSPVRPCHLPKES